MACKILSGNESYVDLTQLAVRVVCEGESRTMALEHAKSPGRYALEQTREQRKEIQGLYRRAYHAPCCLAKIMKQIGEPPPRAGGGKSVRPVR